MVLTAEFYCSLISGLANIVLFYLFIYFHIYLFSFFFFFFFFFLKNIGLKISALFSRWENKKKNTLKC